MLFGLGFWILDLCLGLFSPDVITLNNSHSIVKYNDVLGFFQLYGHIIFLHPINSFFYQAKAAGRSPEDFHKIGDETGVSYYRNSFCVFICFFHFVFEPSIVCFCYLLQAIILRNYEGILKSCNALDYHDFISCSVKLLTDFPEGLHHQTIENWRSTCLIY